MKEEGVRTAGIDIGSEQHVLAVIDETGKPLVRPTKIGEDAAGYERVFALLGDPADVAVAMEATGHYWCNLFAALAARGYAVALINPLRTARFAEEDLQRTKTDAIDALGIARFALEKQPAPARLRDETLVELRELVSLRLRAARDLADRVRALHRLVDLTFPELTRWLKDLGSERATAILHRYPTAAAIAQAPQRALAAITTDGRHRVGPELATKLREAAHTTVGAHQGAAYARGVRYACEDIARLRLRIKELDAEIGRTLSGSDLAPLLRSIQGIGTTTAAHLIAVLGDPADFRSGKAIASFVGTVPGLRESGKRRPRSARLHPLGHAALRHALWMPTLVAIRR
ncbi:MAG: IS110 family transposase, partial [Chloroflexota bacterium]